MGFYYKILDSIHEKYQYNYMIAYNNDKTKLIIITTITIINNNEENSSSLTTRGADGS
jgi:hypothetical protein